MHVAWVSENGYTACGKFAANAIKVGAEEYGKTLMILRQYSEREDACMRCVAIHGGYVYNATQRVDKRI